MSKLQLQITLMVEEYTVAKAPQVMILCDNKDICIGQADINIQAGFKWSASSTLGEAEEWLHCADIIVTVSQSRFGLDCITRPGKPEGVSWHGVKRDPDETA